MPVQRFFFKEKVDSGREMGVDNPKCEACGNAMKRNGRTSAGAQRWRCKACGASSTHRVGLVRLICTSTASNSHVRRPSVSWEQNDMIGRVPTSRDPSAVHGRNQGIAGFDHS